MTRLVSLAIVLAGVGGACITYSDPCEGVACGDTEVCIALESGPRCVCRAGFVEAEDGTCVAEDAGDADAGPVDGG
jgi:hypothetical protein